MFIRLVVLNESLRVALFESFGTPRPRAALLMCLKKYSATGNSAMGNYVVLCSKITLKTVLLEVSYGKND